MVKTLTIMFLPVLLLTSGLGNMAQAATTTTHAEYYWDCGPMSDSDDDSGAGDISSRVAYPDIPAWDGILGDAAGNDAGRVAAKAWYIAACGGGMDFSANASATWTNVFTAGSSGNYRWDFTIQDGELRIYDWCYGPEMAANYNIEISLDGSVLWNSSAELFGGMVGYTYTVSGTDLGGTPFGGVSPPNIDNEFGYTYGIYSGSLDLGYFNQGDPISLSCLVEVQAGGPGYETGASAFFGDPEDLTGGGIYGNLIPDASQCACMGDLAEPLGQVDLQDLDAMVNMLVDAGPPFIVPVGPGHCGDFDENGQVDLQDLDALVNLLVNAGPPFILPCQ